jgi:SAM-dependent methyltransferase
MTAAVSAPVNHWPDSKCAKAFWQQADLPSYQRLLADTVAWLDPQPGQRWLDLGCGGGQITRALWKASRGQVGEIIGLDCAPLNETAYARLCATVEPKPAAGQIRFVAENFSGGLPTWETEQFDGVVSGLSIQYAEDYAPEKGGWNTAAYDRLLARVRELLRPGGKFVFSVNVPEPNWAKIALLSLPNAFRAVRSLRYLKNSWRLMRYGRWLKQQARSGRFHYLPADVIADKLAYAGFVDIGHQLSYAGQAYIFRCRRSAVA